MNMTAKQVKEELIEDMKRIFDNPTAFTLNSLFIIPATKDKLMVAIKIKDFAGKGTPASKYLSAQIEGGTRAPKSTEKKLRNIGKLNPGGYVMPGKGLKLNQYGNVAGSKYTQILSAVRAFEEAGYTMNRVGSTRKRGRPKKGEKAAPLTTNERYFVIHNGSKSSLKPGVYYRSGSRTSGKIKPILIFTKAPHYSKKFEFFELAVKHYKEKIQENTNKATAIIYGKGTP